MPWSTYGDAATTYGDSTVAYGGNSPAADIRYGDRLFGHETYGGPLDPWDELRGPVGPQGEPDLAMKRPVTAQVAFASGYRAYPGFTDSFVTRDRNGMVAIQSVFQAPSSPIASGTQIGTVPPGFRPSNCSPPGSYPRVMLPFQGANCHGRLDVDPGGALTVGSGPQADWVIVDGFWFSEVPETFVLKGCVITGIASLSGAGMPNTYQVNVNAGVVTTAGDRTGFTREAAYGALNRTMWTSGNPYLGLSGSPQILVCLPVVDQQGAYWPEWTHAANPQTNIFLYRSLDTSSTSGGSTPTMNYPPGWSDVPCVNNLDGAGPFDVTWTANGASTRWSPNLNCWVALECAMVQAGFVSLPAGTVLAYVENEVEMGRVTSDGRHLSLYCQAWRDLGVGTTIGFRFYNPTSSNLVINGEAYYAGGVSNLVRVVDAGAFPDTTANDGRNWAGMVCPEAGTYLIEAWVQNSPTVGAGGYAFIMVNGVTQIQFPGSGVATGVVSYGSWQGTLNEGDWIALGGSNIRSPSSGYWGQYDGVTPMLKVTRLDTVTGHLDRAIAAASVRLAGDPVANNWNLILADRRTGAVDSYFNGFTSELAALQDYYTKCHLIPSPAGYKYKALLATFQSVAGPTVADRRWLPYAEGSS